MNEEAVLRTYTQSIHNTSKTSPLTNEILQRPKKGMAREKQQTSDFKDRYKNYT